MIMRMMFILSVSIVMASLFITTTYANAAPDNIQHEYAYKWGSSGSGNGEFDGPTGIAMDSIGNVYVTDSSNHRIQKFASDGTYITQWGSFGDGEGEFDRPGGIFIDCNDQVYVADRHNHRLQKFNTDGEFIEQWGSFGDGEGEFKLPSDIVIMDAVMYVADLGNHRIQKFTSDCRFDAQDGLFLLEWGQHGNNDGEFNAPIAVTRDSTGNVYVADSANNRIQVFTSDGTYITQWGSSGSNHGEFGFIPDVAIDSSDNVYVSDGELWNGNPNNNRIQVFTSDGTYITQWGSFGDGEGEFDRPGDVLIDDSDNVYVIDGGNNRIQVFKVVADTEPKPPKPICPIANAVLDSKLAPLVQELRETRDNVILKTESGNSFMNTFLALYYTFGPTIVHWENENPVFKEMVKITITPMLASLSILNYVDIDSEGKMLAYGIGVILLNIGMYFIAPSIALNRLSKKFRKNQLDRKNHTHIQKTNHRKEI